MPDTHTSGRASSPRIPRRAIVAALLALVLIVAVVEGYRGWQTIADVQDGRDAIRAGQDVIEGRRLDATAEDLAVARGHFEEAERSFGSAHDRMGGDPFLSVVRRLPVIGTQGSAALHMAEIGESAATIGLEGIALAEKVQRIRDEDDRTLLEKSMVVFEAADPHMQEIDRRLAGVEATRAEIGDARLLPPMGSAIDELDDRRARLVDFVEQYDRARAFAPEFLGFNGPRSYLVMAHNEAEILPGGGLVSVVGTLRLNEGRIEELDFQDSVQFGYDWMERTGAYLEPPRPLKQYLLKDTSWNLLVSNWSPDFPTSATTAQRFFELGGGTQSHGVIGINVRTLEQLLTVTGPVYIEEYDVEVNAENAFELTEANTRQPFEPQADRKEFVAVLADAVLDRVLHPAPGSWSALLDVVQKLGDERDMQLYSYNREQQALIREFGWDGELTHDGGDFLMLVDASVHSTKLNAVIDQDVAIDVQLGDDGEAVTTVTVDYDNDLASWEQGRDPELVRRLMLGGLYGGYLRLFTAPRSTILSVTNGESEIGVEEVSSEKGLRVFGRYFAMPRDTQQRLIFRYSSPDVVEREGDSVRYRLQLAKQSGAHRSVTLAVTPPDGARLRAATIDGERVEANGDGRFAIDSSRDRAIEFEFR